MEFGGVLKRMRKEAGYSQEEMAERLHVSRSNISRLESNKLELKAADLLNWARETNSQDVIIALVYSVDVAMVTDIAINLSDVINAGMIFIGGFL